MNNKIVPLIKRQNHVVRGLLIYIYYYFEGWVVVRVFISNHCDCEINPSAFHFFQKFFFSQNSFLSLSNVINKENTINNSF